MSSEGEQKYEVTRNWRLSMVPKSEASGKLSCSCALSKYISILNLMIQVTTIHKKHAQEVKLKSI